MYNLSLLRKLPVLTLCLLITQLTFAKSPYWAKNLKSGSDLGKTSARVVPTNPPTGVSVSSTSICNGSSVSLTATCSAGTVTWYTQATGGTSIGSGSPLSKSPTTSTTYYASCLVSGGPARIAAGSESTRVFAGTVTVTSIPAESTSISVSQTTICVGDSVTLNANCSSGTVTWYKEANFIGTGTGLRQSPTDEFTRYFAKCINGSCQSGFAAADGVTVNPRPDFPTEVSVDQTSICSGTSITLTANCSAGTLTWYNQATGGSAIGIDTDFSQSPTENTTYYASCQGELCESIRVATDSVTVTTMPSIPTSVSVDKTNICQGDSVTLMATCEVGMVVWNTESGSIGTGTGLTQSPTENTVYYAICKNESCESNQVLTEQVNVNSVPDIPTDVSVNKTAIINGAPVSLSATCASGSVIWYNQLSGGAAIGTGAVIYYPKATVTYYATCKSGNCESNKVATTQVVVTAMNLVPYLVSDVLVVQDMYGEMEDYPSPNSVNVNGILYFRGKNTTYGQELWKSDGTEAGTVLVKDINPGTGDSEPENFLVVNGIIFFTAKDGTNGVELWKTDGTPDGTEMVKNINPSGDSYPSSLTNFNGTLFFSARNNPSNAELWKSDGTPDGTVQVKDINTAGGSYPSSFAIHKGTLYFAATDAQNGQNNYELWKTDGSEAGTVVVKEINPSASANVGKLKSIGDILYFYGSSASNNYELWRTDGTADNTYMVKDINPVSGPSSISSLTELNGILYFSAYDGYGHELWRSNGTADSTFMVKDIRPGNTGSGPSYLTNINGTVFFAASDANENSELWKTDGTTMGTVKVKEINPTGNAIPMYLTNLDGTLYFSASSINSGYNYNIELWKSDGTEAGTVLVKDLNTASGSSPREFRAVNGKLYFGASGKKNIEYYDKELWSLGTCTDANSIVSKPNKTAYYNSQAQPTADTLTCHCSMYNELISKVKATGANPISSEIDAKEWLEETAPNTYLRRHYEINPVSNDTTSTGKVTLYFTQADFDAYNETAGSNKAFKLPESSDDASGISQIKIERRTGTSNDGTGLISTYTKGIETIDPTDTDIVWNSTANRWEVSFSNTGFGGFFLKSETISDPTGVSVSTNTICAGNSVSLTATCSTGTVVWYSQASASSSIGTGSPLQVALIASTTCYAACEAGETTSNRVAAPAINVISLPTIPTGVAVNKTSIINGASVSLSATCASGSVIWYNQLSGGAAIGTGSTLVYYPVSDITYYASCKNTNCESSRIATSPVTVTAMNLLPYMVKDINPGAGNSGIIGLSLINNILYFRATAADSGEELWKTDGTGSGTTLLKDIVAGANSSSINNLISIDNNLYFKANDGVNGTELWISDGTVNGTKLLKDIGPTGMDSELDNFTNVNGILYFTANDGTNGTELWKSNGTEAGTVMVKNIAPGSQGSSPSGLFNFKGTLYFNGNDGTTQGELWKSDGTEAGTVLVKDINPSGYGEPGGFIVAKNNFFFSAVTPSNGKELWISDGTEAGTKMVKDINPGSGHSYPMRFGVIDSTLYFMAKDAAGDEELWKSDGTEAGTARVKNIRATGSSTPFEMVNLNGILMFTADDGIHGKELWKSDGTDDGTTLVKDINLSGLSGIEQLKNINGTLYFKANDGTNGMELWKSDGTEAGTVMVKDVWSGSTGSNPDYFSVFNGKMYFRARTTHNSLDYGYEFWSLGTCTNANTLATNFNKTLYYNRQVQPSSAATTCHCDVFNNIISTTEAAGTNPVSGNISASMWIESVTPSTFIRRHYEINPESGDTTATAKLTLYFTQADFDAYSTAVGTNAYKYPTNSSDAAGISNIRIMRWTGTSNDGTGLTATYTKGTETINPTDTDIVWSSIADRWEVSFTNTGFGGFFLTSETIAPPTAVAVNTTAICEGSSVSLTATCTAGTVVWYNEATGGSTIGTGSSLQVSLSTSTTHYAACETEDLKSTRVATNAVVVTAQPTNPTEVSADKTDIISGSTVILTATCSTGFVVWYKQETGGSSIGAGLPFRYYPDSTTTFYAACKMGNCISSRVATNQVTVTSMAQVPYMVKNIQVDNNAGQTDRLTDVNGIVFFESGDDEGHGKELWKTDGTAAGTMMVKDIREGSGDSQIYLLTNVNGTLFFRAVDNAHGTQLWKSDGTDAGTQIVKEMQFRGGSYTIDNLINVNGTLFFTADLSASGVELWKSDGTESGTQLVKDINPGSANSNPSNLINADGILYFIADDGTNEKELWRTDGTEAGTVKMTSLGAYQFPMELVYFKGSVFYSVRTQNTFRASLWKSSGIPGGVDTKLNTTDQVEIYKMTVAGDVLYFASDDFVYGNELWKTDSTSQGTTIVKDIRPANTNGGNSSSPDNLTNVNSTLFFTANDGINGRKLWKSNGTEASTTMVKNIQPGDGMSGSGSGVLFTNVEGIAYFQANDQSGDNELWRTDGTDAGTFRVKDLRPNYSSSPNNLVNVNGKLFFRAGTILDGVALGYEPMALGTCTDANLLVTTNGKSVNYNSQVQPGSDSLTCHCDIFNNLISTVNASGVSPVSGEITTKAWIESTASTDYVKRHYEIYPATNANTATGKVTLYFTQADFDAYYAADTSRTFKLPLDHCDSEGMSHIRIEKREGVSSDGSGLPGTYSGAVTIIDPEDSDIVWNDDKQRWAISFNTTGFGGFFVKSADVIEPTEVSVSTTAICTGSNVSLTATCAAGTVVWYNQASGGSTIGTASPLEVSPTEKTVYYATCETLEQSSNRIATDSVSVYEIPQMPIDVATNKAITANGTSISLTATCPVGNVIWYNQVSGGSPIGMGSALIYTPAASSNYYVACRNDVCQSERVDVGFITLLEGQPYMVKDINPITDGESSPKNLYNANGTLYFAADDGVHGNELWKTDASGTSLVKDINSGGAGVGIDNFTFLNGTTYFSVAINDSLELWKTNGSTDGTTRIKNIGATTETRQFTNFRVLNDTLYFITYDNNTFETSLWKSDGSGDGTAILQNLNTDSTYNDLPEVLVMNGALYFPAAIGGSGIELWKTDGTHTTLVRDFNQGDDGRPTNLTVIYNTLYFTANDGSHGRELWRSDGNEEGTELVKDIFGGGDGSDPIKLTNVNGVLYFVATDGINERELLKSDGTEAGTELVQYINEGEYDSAIDQLINVNGTLYFTATTEANGNELWKSDGSGTTSLVKDINPGAEGSGISNLTNVNGVLYFQAKNSSNNTELWKTDGTEDGTVMVKEINAGDEGSNPSYLTNSGGLYFAAKTVFDEVNYGTELWSLGVCSDENLLVSNTGRSANYNSQILLAAMCNCDVFNNLISKIEATGDNPVTGEVVAKVWNDTTATTDYVKRHYEINPVSGDNTTTGKVTLYFTQADFDAYYAADTTRTFKLPLDHCDSEGMSHIRIEKREGTSNDGTGLPGTYSGAVTIIDPADEDIYWSNDKQRWAISFNTTGFGGFFVKSFELKEPTDIVVSNESICVGLSVSLEANCEMGTVTWYNTASGGSAIGTGSPVWFVPIETTTYYAACESAEFTGTRVLADTVVVKALPLGPTNIRSDKSSVCNGGVVSLTATCPSGTVYWYTNYSGVPPLASGTSIIVTPSSTRVYYASCRDNGCESPKSATATITVTSDTISIPEEVSVSSTNVCNGSSVSLTATCSTGTVTWYNQATGGSAIGTGSGLSQIPTEATIYYASCKNDSCETPRVETSPVIVLALPLVPTGVSVNKTIVTNGQSVLLTATCGSGSVLWYNQPSGGSALLIGSSSVHYPSTTATYYATCKIGNCESNRVATSQLVVVAMEQLPYIVKNINADQNSAPIHFTNVNGILYFVATDGIHGNELWKTDGTETGTKRITDINTEGDSEIDNITSVNGTIYFTVKTEIFFELWKTNGSEEGTEKVKDISEEFEIQEVTSLRAVNNTLYFIVSNSSDHITQLWTSDGSANGTVKVKDINQEGANLNLNEAVVINNALFFQGNKIASGTELWKLENGNAGIVFEINDIGRYDVPTLPIEVNEIGSSYPKNLTDVKGVLYFTADDGIHGRELWRYDGSMEGSYLVKDIKEGIESSTPDNLTNVNGVLYFTADNGTNGLELWKTDGTNAGTVLVKDIASDEGSGNPKFLTNVNGTVYFVAYSDEGNRELWKTDGTSDSTILVKDINPGGEPSSIEYLTNVNGKLYFVADDGVNGTELWTSNGTEAGTVMVKDIYPGIEGSNLANLFNVNGKLYFSARTRLDDIDYWNELWSLGTCAIDNTLANRTGRTEHFNQATQPGSDLFTCHCDVYNHLMTTAKAVTYPEIIGDLAIKEWIDETDDATKEFVKRHYEIYPAAGDTTINRRIILYFTQDDFDTYNTLAPENALKLPTDSADTIGMSNLLIEYHKGISSDFETGSPETYEGNPTKILPTAIVPYWIGSLNRWSVSFETKGFGGFFLKTPILTKPDSVSVSNVNICSGDSVSLIAYCTYGTVNWYSASGNARVNGDASTLIGTGSPLVIAPTPETIYLASCKYGENISEKIATPEITVNETPEMPTGVSVSSSNICSGTSITLSATCATGTITWYNQATGGSAIDTGNDLSQSPSETITYYVSCKSDNCESSREATNEVVVTAMPDNPADVSVDNTAICYGTSVSLTATCASGTIKWFTQETGSTPIGTGSPLSQSPSATTTYYASCVNGDCASNRVATDEVVVTAIPTIPTSVSVNKTAICDDSSVSLTATCASGSVEWFTQSTGGDPIGYNSPLNDFPSSSTTYYASCVTGNCASTRVATSKVIVTAIPSSPTDVSVDQTAICEGAEITLTAGCADGTVHWFTQLTGGVSIGENSEFIRSPSVTTTYYASCINGDCASTRVATNQVVVTTMPTNPTSVSVNNTTICSGTAVSLTATCATGTITWYNQATGGTAIGTGNALSQSPSSTITYYASCKNGNCESSRVSTSQVVLTTQPTTPTGVSVNNTAICSGTAVSLTATCATGTITWYNQATVGTAIGTGTALSQSPSVTTTYYASCKNGNCESSRGATNQLVVTTQPTTPTSVSVNNTAICSGTAVSLTATCATGTITWYNQATGGTAVGTGNALSQSPSVTTTYYASCKNGNCESIMVSTSQVVVTTQPTTPTSVSVNNTAICSGTAVSLTATCATGTITWYNQATGGTAVGTGNALSQSPSVTTTYYASCKNGNCESSRGATNQLVVTTQPTTPPNVLSNKTAICNGTSVSLTATCATGTITWYNVSSGGSAIGTGNNLSQSPTVNTTYYAACVNGACLSNRIPISSEVVVTTAPSTPSISVSKTSICHGESITLTATCLTGTPIWYTQPTGGTAVGTGSPLTQSATVNVYYFAACIDGICESGRRGTSLITVNAQPTAPTNVLTNKSVLCTGESITLSATCSIGTVNWYASTNGGTANTGASIGTGSSLVLNPTVADTYVYVAECKTTACASEKVGAAEVLVKATPNKPVISGATEICAGESTALTAYSSNTFSDAPTYYWSDGLTGNSITVSPSTAKSYRLLGSFNGCNSDSSDVFNLVVNPIPVAPILTATKTAICSGDSAVLTGQCASVTDVFKWKIAQLRTSSALVVNQSDSASRVVKTTGTYKAWCESAKGCKSAEASITITQGTDCNGQNIIVISPEKPVICPNTSVTLTAAGCTGVITWTDGTSTKTGTSAVYSPTVNTTYTAQCSVGGSASVVVKIATADLIIGSDITTGTSIEKATKSIESEKKIGAEDITPGANVSYESGGAIILKPGFVVEKGSVFKTEIKTCL